MIETVQNSIPTDLVEKVRKLLSLSLSDNPHEAELALSKARKWAAEYEIDLSAINIHGQQKAEPIVKGDTIHLGQRKPTVNKYLAWLLESHFNVKIVYSGRRCSGRQMVFIGRTADIQMAQYVYSYLEQEFPRLWKAYYDKNYPEIQLKDKQSFCYGMYKGLDAKLIEAQKQAEEEKFQTIQKEMEPKAGDLAQLEQIKQCYSLAIVTHKESLNKALGEFYPHLSNAYNSGKNLRCGSAMDDGRVIGRTINLNRPIGNSAQSKIGG